MVFISIVGLRPSSVAVTAKTIYKLIKTENSDKEPVKALLFATGKTISSSDRLKEFIEKELNWPTEIVHSEDSVIADKISEIINDFGSIPVFFNISAGLSFVVAKIARMTANSRAFLYPVFAEARKLYSVELPDKRFHPLFAGVPLENIGIEWLFKLYGVNAFWKEVVEIEGKKIFLEMEIKSPADRYSLEVPVACETKGNLRCFTWINNKDVFDGRNIKYLIDKTLGYSYAPNVLNYLRPEFSFFTDSPKVNKELQFRGFHVISTKQDVDVNFILTELSLKPDLMEVPLHQKGSYHGKNNVGEDIRISLSGRSKGLVVCLGSEPESTLLALRTHKWDNAIVLFDNNSGYITALADRLKKYFVGIHLWPCSVYGSIDRESKFIEIIGRGEWHCNISPGSKAQSWKLARIFPESRLWSLDTRKRKAVCIFKSDRGPDPLPFINVPIRIIAEMNGIYASEKITFDNLKEKLQFLQAMGAFFAEWKRDKNYIIIGESWSPGKLIKLKGGKRLECTGVGSDQIFFKLIMDGKTYKGSLQGPPDQGNWLEEIVAGVFMLAGGSDVTDACVSLEFKWDDFNSRKNSRTELDVILRWKEAYIAVSCKLGVPKRMITDVLWEIASEARDKLGRRAIPVLVSGHFDDQSEDPEKRALTSAEEGIAVEISISLLDRPEIIRQAVEKAIESKKTVFTGRNN